MKKKIGTILICTILISFTQLLYSQKDSIGKINDSLNTSILQEYNRMLNEADYLRVADSIKRVDLEIQLHSLKANANFKEKEELQKKLLDLKEKEDKRIALKRIQIDSLRQTAKAYPVLGFFDDTLFSIYSRFGSFSAKDRAEAITLRVNHLKEHYGFKPDSLLIAESENTVEIVFGENIVMSISENDADWENSTKMDLAKKYRLIIADAVINYNSQTSAITIFKEFAFAFLIILVIIFLIRYVIIFFKWTASVIQQQENQFIKGIKLKNYTLFDARKQVRILLFSNKIIKWIIIILIAYITLPVLFGIFPWTKNFADVLFGYILNPVKKIASGLWNYLPNMFTIIVIITIFRYVSKGARFLKNEIENGNLSLPGFYPDWANPTYQIVRILIFAFMIVAVFPYLPGSESPIFRGITVFLGFLFTFGSAGSLSNIMAGLVLTYMRLFKIGDHVKIGDVFGDVIEKSLLVTRVRTIKNEIISIPNSTVMSSHTTNYSSDAPEKGLIIHTTITIGYNVPWRDMHQALIDAAIKTELILESPHPFVLQTSLDDFYVSYQVNAYIREANKQAIIYSNLHQNIQDICNERGIEIMSPHFRSARDGNMSTLPADYLPKDYQKPGFDINIKNSKID